MVDQTVSVLLVEDDPHASEIFTLVMAHYRIPAAVVNNAESALEYLANRAFDVVMIDLFLPESDGYQLLRKIRAAALAPNSKLVATTAYHTNDTAQETLSRGFDGFFPKPLEFGQLVSYLKSVTES